MNTKIFINMILSLGLSFTFISCSDSTDTTKAKTTQVVNAKKVLLNVEGMTCEGCEMAIQNSLSKLDGVSTVKASHVDKTTAIDFDASKITVAEIETAIVETGYKIMSESIKKELKEAPASAMKCGEGKCGESMKRGSTK